MKTLTSALIALLSSTVSLTGCSAFVAPSVSSMSLSTASRRTAHSTGLFMSTTEQPTDTVGKPGTADLPWDSLGFEFRPTKSHLKMTYKDGKWEAPEMVESPYFQIHIGATALHYGQACFEGLKAFAHDDGSVYLFRPDENAKRINASSGRIMMPEIPTKCLLRHVTMS